MSQFPEMDRLLHRMERQLAAFDRQRDHRAAFLRVYTHMTRRVIQRLEGEFFLDPQWLQRVALRFADYYFDALEAYNARRPCPPAWQLSFHKAATRRAFLLQDVVLGVNAHINNDLPQVLAEILRTDGDWPDPARMARRRYDHDQINRLLHEIVPAVEGEVSRHYGRLIGLMGKLAGSLDASLAAFGLKQFRDNTWRQARFLLAAQDAEERAQVREWLEADALFVGELVDRYGALPLARPVAGLMRRLRLL